MTIQQLSTAVHAKESQMSELGRKGYLPKTKFSDATDTGLEKAIIAHVDLVGGMGECIRNSGRVLPAKRIRTESGQMLTKGSDKYIQGSGRNGTPDLLIKLPFTFGRHMVAIYVGVEVKIGADRMSEAQIEYMDECGRIHAHYYIVCSFADWIAVYNGLVKIYGEVAK